MRTLYITLMAVLASAILTAQAPNESLLPLEHLLAINAQWEGKTVSETEPVSFQNDTERIAYHLGQVIERLSAESHPDPLVDSRRNELIRTLEMYRLAGQFPINTGHSVRTPYFIDDFGTACAVGHLMIESGHEDLAFRIRDEHNFDYVADIKTDGVVQWAIDHGFSLDELALIQPAYTPSQQMSAVGNGVNGPIKSLCAIFDERMYIAGDFDEMDGTIGCETGIGYYEDETYHCIANAPVGDVHDMRRSSNYDLLVAGNLIFGGENYPLAKYSNDTWELISLPERPNAIGKSVRYTYSQYDRYLLCIDPDDGSGNNEIWRWNEAAGGSWHLVLTTMGPINSIANQYYDFVGGDFDSYVDHLDDDQIVPADGLLRLNLYSNGLDEAIPYQSEFLPDAIQVLVSVGEILYIGGTCDEIYPNTFLTRLQNNAFQALIYEDQDFGQTNVGLYDISPYADNQLLVAGDMDLGGIGIIGNNIGVYDPLGGTTTALTYLDAPARTISFYNGEYYVGGDFIENVGYPLNHIAKIGVANGLIEIDTNSWTLSPNPTADYFDIIFEEPIREVRSMRVYDLSAKEYAVSTRLTDQTVHVDVKDLSPGVYLFSIETENGLVSGRFVKE